ncbi:MAG: DoxX family protein [Crocinitomicaceae bacterium]|nr:DoxX family protein [Crocinitomicaceae bacterium]
MKTLIAKFNTSVSKLKDFPLLFIRLILAYGFYKPAMMKLTKTESVVKFFDSAGIPFPTLNVYLAGITEGLGVILLVLGLGTRIISIPLMITMIVAITVVHWDNGFKASENGIQIPLYFLIMLFVLLVYGSGKFSVDYLIGKKQN